MKYLDAEEWIVLRAMHKFATTEGRLNGRDSTLGRQPEVYHTPDGITESLSYVFNNVSKKSSPLL